MHDPGMGHWEVVKWILWYINGITDVGLVFKKNVTGKQECIGYVDSDYTETLTNVGQQRDMCLHSQAPVSWRSTL